MYHNQYFCHLAKMSQTPKNIAQRVIAMEAAAVAGLASLVDDSFDRAVEMLQNCKGRVVLSGIGKSSIIAQKIAATFNSTGTPSIFMHAADALHGDLGIVQENDVVIILSKSGNSPEVKALIPLIKNFGNSLIAVCGNNQSQLAQQADIFLDTTVEQEACPNNLAPTSSTTAQMVMGDALAVTLMELKGFKEGDFAKFHPGGTLGKKLYLRVADIFTQNEKPAVLPGQSLKEVIVEITKKRLGVTAVVDEQQNLVGIITDGDLRRMLEKNTDIENVAAKDIMTHHPKNIQGEELAITALDLMRKNAITQLVVTNGKKYAGIIHIHDLLKEGLI